MPTAQTKVSDSEYLCYCALVHANTFLQAVEEPPLAFERVCQTTGVGMRCTACLQAAESLYLDRIGGRSLNSEQPIDSDTTRPAAARLLQFGKGLIEWIEPKAANRLRSYCPIVRMSNFKTTLMVSNASSRIPRAMPVPHALKVTVRDTGGNVLEVMRKRIDVGKAVELPLSDFLLPDDSGIAFGSADIVIHSVTIGHQGSIRPHLKIASPHATSWVHTTNVAGNEAQHVYVQGPSNVTNALFVRNCSAAANTVEVNCSSVGEGDLKGRSQAVLPPQGSAWIELDRLAVDGGVCQLKLTASQPQRTYFIVYDNLSLSADHI